MKKKKHNELEYWKAVRRSEMCPQQNIRVNANEQQQQSETKHTKNTLIGFDAVEMHVRKSNNRNKNNVRMTSDGKVNAFVMCTVFLICGMMMMKLYGSRSAGPKIENVQKVHVNMTDGQQWKTIHFFFVLFRKWQQKNSIMYHHTRMQPMAEHLSATAWNTFW